MTQRSIFDILMDIWFLPTITDYVKMLVKPIIYKLSPEEATKVLEDFNPSVRKVFLTKGIVHLLPNEMKNLMLPNSIEKLEEEENISGSTRENELFEVILNKIKIKSDSSLKNNSEKCNCNFLLEEEKAVSLDLEKKVTYIDKDNHIRRKSSDKILVKDNIKQENIKRKPVCLMGKNKETNIMTKEYDYVEIEDSNQGLVKYKTRVIESSDKINSNRRKNNRITFDKIHNILKKSNIPLNNFRFEDLEDFNCNCDLKQYYWDNLDSYYQKVAKNALKEEKNLSPKVNILLKKVSFVNVLSELIKNNIHLKVNFEKIGRYSIILISTLLIQAIINRKITHLSFSLLNFISFLCTSFGISTILYLGFFKEKNKMIEGDQSRDKGNKESLLVFNGIKAKLKN